MNIGFQNTDMYKRNKKFAVKWIRTEKKFGLPERRSECSEIQGAVVAKATLPPRSYGPDSVVTYDMHQETYCCRDLFNPELFYIH